MNNKNLNKLITEALAIEAEDAKEAGAVGFMARALVQATMPHSKTEEIAFKRINGAFTLSIVADPDIGLPFGSIPRLLVSYLTTEAVRTKERDILLGPSLSSFMREIGLDVTGGRGGSIGRLKGQMARLFAAGVRCTYTAENRMAGVNLAVADRYDLWWDPKNPDQETIFSSYVRLGEPFFDEVTQNPIPIDVRALSALKQSPMALDIYCWLTYRMSYLRKPTVIPWGALQVQFGADYKLTRQFKAAFMKHLRSVVTIYPASKVAALEHGLELRPSKTHVPRLTTSE